MDVNVKDVRKLTNQDELAQIAVKSPDKYVRRAAVKNVTDEDVLMDIIKTDDSAMVRKVAVNRIGNEKALENIALKDPAHSVRKSAVNKINDENVLVHIARFDTNNGVRQIAWDKIKKINPNLILTAEDVFRIFDEERLIEIARYGLTWQSREAAVSKITDENVYDYLYLTYQPMGKIDYGQATFNADLHNLTTQYFSGTVLYTITDADDNVLLATMETYSNVEPGRNKAFVEGAIPADEYIVSYEVLEYEFTDEPI